MATNPDNVLGTAPVVDQTAPVTPAPAPTAPGADNNYVFRIPNTETDISVDLSRIPPEVRMGLLKSAVKAYINNSANQVGVKYRKLMEPFEAYKKAMAADPLQSAVKKPEGDEPTADYIKPAADARERLYSGEIRRHGEGGGETKGRERVDPLTQMVTKAVVTELYEKRKASDPKFKIMDAQKEVGKNGIEYLDKLIADKVAAGADAAALAKFKEERYIKPAQMMLGIKTNKATAETSLLG